MTSVAVSVGIANDERTNSRVLRPPGGYTNDIFNQNPSPETHKDVRSGHGRVQRRNGPATSYRDSVKDILRDEVADAKENSPKKSEASFGQNSEGKRSPKEGRCLSTHSLDSDGSLSEKRKTRDAKEQDRSDSKPADKVPTKSPPSAGRDGEKSAASSSPVAAGVRSEIQQLFGNLSTRPNSRTRSYDYRNRSSIVFGDNSPQVPEQSQRRGGARMARRQGEE